MKTPSRKAKTYLVAAGIVFSILVADILVAKIQVMMGVIIPVHIGDTGQFLVLLAAVILFVIGAIFREELIDGEALVQCDQEATNRRPDGEQTGEPGDERRT
jgi:uncharacterized membrane protein (DUF106 family)